jgi:hypothetical protein
MRFARTLRPGVGVAGYEQLSRSRPIGPSAVGWTEREIVICHLEADLSGFPLRTVPTSATGNRGGVADVSRALYFVWARTLSIIWHCRPEESWTIRCLPFAATGVLASDGEDSLMKRRVPGPL